MRKVQLRLDVGVETVATNVRDHTDDLDRDSIVVAVKHDAPADRILVWKVSLYKRIADDHHLRSVCRVAVSKHASATHGDAHRAEVIFARNRVIGYRFVAGFIRCASFDLESLFDVEIGERDVIYY